MSSAGASHPPTQPGCARLPNRPRRLALIVDGDGSYRAGMVALLTAHGFDTRTARNLCEARRAVFRTRPDVILAGLDLPDGGATDLVGLRPGTEVVVIVRGAGEGSAAKAAAAVREGALDFLVGPCDRPRLESILAHLARTRHLEGELGGLRDELRRMGRFGKLIGRSGPMQEVYRLIAQVAPTRDSLLVLGERGTGKELVAETIHALSPRRLEPFQVLRCDAGATEWIEGKLFGLEAERRNGRPRIGRLESCGAGTLLLDEITALARETQQKLLNALETGRFRRIGGKESIATHAHIVATTCCDPAEAVARGVLLGDLYHRLDALSLRLPALRDRGDDLELLARHFVDEMNEQWGASRHWTESGLEALKRRLWLGNVRELRDGVHRAFVLADGAIDRNVVQTSELQSAAKGTEGPGVEVSVEVRVPIQISEVEKRLILATLRYFEGNKKRSAEALGISLKTLYSRLDRYRAERDAG